ncbi:tetratricopeptide repeat protein [Roseospirillum parvum]|nr:tetratricopeptide repeat protein [Roseospirillum parvum]
MKTRLTHDHWPTVTSWLRGARRGAPLLLALLCAVPNAAWADPSALAEAEARLANGDGAAALARALPLAEAGDGAAQELAGRILGQGLGVPRDLAAACSWHRAAAAQGRRLAMHNHATCLAGGVGTADGQPDPAAAARWYGKAAEAGLTRSLCAEGELRMAGGPGLAAEPARGRDLCLEAARAGVPSAQATVGELFLTGRADTPKDPAQAAQWLEKAARGGIVPAAYWLGRLYLVGNGVPVNRPRALGLFRAAAEAGLPEAQIAYGEMLYARALDPKAKALAAGPAAEALFWLSLGRRGLGPADAADHPSANADRLIAVLGKHLPAETRRAVAGQLERVGPGAPVPRP